MNNCYVMYYDNYTVKKIPATDDDLLFLALYNNVKLQVHVALIAILAASRFCLSAGRFSLQMILLLEVAILAAGRFSLQMLLVFAVATLPVGRISFQLEHIVDQINDHHYPISVTSFCSNVSERLVV